MSMNTEHPEVAAAIRRMSDKTRLAFIKSRLVRELSEIAEQQLEEVRVQLSQISDSEASWAMSRVQEAIELLESAASDIEEISTEAEYQDTIWSD